MFRALLCPSSGARDYNVAYNFIVLLIGGTYFGHYYAHH